MVSLKTDKQVHILLPWALVTLQSKNDFLHDIVLNGYNIELCPIILTPFLVYIFIQ